MKHYFIALVLVVLFQVPKKSFGQDLVTTKPLELRTNSFSSVLPIVEADHTYLTFFSKKAIQVIRYDQNFVQDYQKLIVAPPAPYKKLLGYALSEDDRVNLYFSNKKRNRFYLISLGQNGTIVT
ncbi:MAG: hypothetical protein AAGA86_11070, partial [Bacteroidota bacterium]